MLLSNCVLSLFVCLYLRVCVCGFMCDCITLACNRSSNSNSSRGSNTSSLSFGLRLVRVSDSLCASVCVCVYGVRLSITSLLLACRLLLLVHLKLRARTVRLAVRARCRFFTRHLVREDAFISAFSLLCFS